MKKLQMQDRLVFDKANRAFVSYIQSYQKHECNLILRLKDLDLGKVGMGFGLLKMPRMPETKGRDVSSFIETEVDLNGIGYKDKQREQNRLGKLSEYRETGIWPGKHKRRAKQTEPWSEAKKRKIERQEKRGKKREKRNEKIEKGLTKKPKKRKIVSAEDIAELAQDIALMKKLKKKKVHKLWNLFIAKNLHSGHLRGYRPDFPKKLLFRTKFSKFCIPYLVNPIFSSLGEKTFLEQTQTTLNLKESIDDV